MIRFDSVTAQMGGRGVLDAVSLSVGAGEFVALCGPNGAGKSSVLRAAVGLLPTSGGEVQLGRDPLGSLSPRTRSERIGYLPQERQFAWNMPAVEIAALGLPFLSGEDARERARQALDELDAGHLADRGVAEMSGGERARVLIARVLAGGASALALDEPVAGLDPDAQLLVLDILKRRAQAGQAVMVSLHDLTLAARYADRVVVLAAGRVLADDTPRKALSSDVVRQAFGIDGDWIDGPEGPLLIARRMAQGR